MCRGSVGKISCEPAESSMGWNPCGREVWPDGGGREEKGVRVDARCGPMGAVEREVASPGGLVVFSPIIE